MWIKICPSLEIHTNKIVLHVESICIPESNREIAGVSYNAVEKSILCSVSCYHFSMINWLAAEITNKNPTKPPSRLQRDLS